MRTIYKYQLEIDGLPDIVTLYLHKGAKLLTFANQDENLTIWAVVDPEAETIPVKIAIFGTGNPIELEITQYIGTDQFANGNLVLHAFLLKDQ